MKNLNHLLFPVSLKPASVFGILCISFNQTLTLINLDTHIDLNVAFISILQAKITALFAREELESLLQFSFYISYEYKLNSAFSVINLQSMYIYRLRYSESAWVSSSPESCTTSAPSNTFFKVKINIFKSRLNEKCLT